MALRAFGSIFAEVEGEPRILALHGWGRRGSDFSAALRGLGFVAPDLPGFGATPPPRVPQGALGYAELIAPILDVLRPQPILIGHSFGGRIATLLAATAPGRFGALVLTGVPLLRSAAARKPPLPYRLGRWANRHSLFPDRLLGKMRRRYGSPDYQAARGIMRDVLVKAVNESYEELLPRLELPVFLLWGADDYDVPVSIAERAAELIPRAKLHVVPMAGHLLPSSHPAELRRVVESLLP